MFLPKHSQKVSWLFRHLHIHIKRIVKPIFMICFHFRKIGSDIWSDFDEIPYVNLYSRETPDQPRISGFSMDFMDLEAQKESGDPPTCRKTQNFA